MNLDNIKIVYFLGIGGIGMSSLARWFNQYGVKVAGYDKTPSMITQSLEEEGIAVVFDESIENLPLAILENKEAALIVYTPAISHKNKFFQYFKTKDFFLYKRAEILGQITKNLFTLAVAGTHGKTTTSTMLAYLLDYANINCTAFLGGIATNFQSNLLLKDNLDQSTIAVVEADEFDRSFLQLSPNKAIITSIEADHLDIYENGEEVCKAYVDFSYKLEDGSIIFLSERIDEKIRKQLNPALTYEVYGLDNSSLNYYAENIRVANGAHYFDYVSPEITIKNLSLEVPGRHNVENMVAAISLALGQSVSINDIKEAVASFKGVKRRFEYHIKTDDKIYIDDYAHHPTEVEAIITSVKELYPNKKLTVIFQPHLFTRTRDFAIDFAKALTLADQIIVLDIYPAREKPIIGITSKLITNKITNKNLILLSKEDVVSWVKEYQPELLLTVGAGDIGNYVSEIKNVFI